MTKINKKEAGIGPFFKKTKIEYCRTETKYLDINELAFSGLEPEGLNQAEVPLVDDLSVVDGRVDLDAAVK